MSEESLPENTGTNPAPTPARKRRPVWKRALRFFAWTSGIFIFLIAVLLVLTWVYQDDVKAYVVEEVNKRVNTTIIVDPKNIEITLIRTFPDVSVNFKEIAALDAVDSPNRDTLLRAGKISLAFNILDLFHSNYSIHNISVEDANLKMWVDKKGNDNYHFLKEDTDTTAATDTAHVVFALDEIQLTNVLCSYVNKQEKSNYKVDFHSVSFTGDFGTDKYEFGTNAEFTIDNIQTGESSFFTGNTGSLDLVMEIDNTTNAYQVKTGKLKLADFGLNVSGNAKENGNNYSLDLAVKGEEIDIRSALSLLPASYHEDIEAYESSGEFYLDGTIKGLYGDSVLPVIAADFGIKPGATVGRKDAGVTLTDVALEGKFSNEKGKDGLEISSFTASSSKSKFNGSFSLMNFKRPRYETKLTGNLDLAEMQELLQIDTIGQMSGAMRISFEASGKPTKSKPSASDFRTFKTLGQLNFDNIMVKLKGAKDPVDSINGRLSFDGNNVTIAGFTAQTAGSDLLINGTVKNLLGYIFTDKEVLDIGGNLSSRNLDLNPLLSDGTENTDNDTDYHLELPQRLRLNLSTSIKHLAFRKFEANSLSGNIVMKNQRLTADPISFHAMDGSFSGSGMIDASENDSLLITCHADIRSVDINQLFSQLENFGQDTNAVITEKNLRGRLTSQVNFASVWSSDLYVNENKIYTDADVSIESGELIDFKPLYELARFIKLEELENVKFQKLSNHIEIKNRVIHIPKMEINSSAANIKMSGTHDFDNMVDYHFIVDLDDLRARKAMSAKKENNEFGEEIADGVHRRRLFISMKGPIDDPDISYDRKGNIDQIKEDLKQEKQNLREILHEEFGWFKGKKDGDKKDRKKEDGGNKFILAQDEDSAPVPKDKKKKPADEDLDDSGDY